MTLTIYIVRDNEDNNITAVFFSKTRAEAAATRHQHILEYLMEDKPNDA